MRVLVAEDDPITRKLVEVHLKKWGHEVTVCSDGAQAWEILGSDDPPALVILDWMMPGMDGATICRELRKQDKHSYIYLILLTARTTKEDVVEGLEAGADDYIAKPFDIHELKVRVRAGSRIIQLQEDLMAALNASEYQASHDALTGLWNRKAIIEQLNKELARSERQGIPVSVVIGDIDHFKLINDTYGHSAGDGALKEVSNRMTDSVRPYDAVGRYGGEEFLILCPGCDLNSALTVAERLRESIAADPIELPEGVLKTTMSFGVACSDDGKNVTADLIISAADKALYKAKESGRNRVEKAESV